MNSKGSGDILLKIPSGDGYTLHKTKLQQEKKAELLKASLRSVSYSGNTFLL